MVQLLEVLPLVLVLSRKSLVLHQALEEAQMLAPKLVLKHLHKHHRSQLHEPLVLIQLEKVL